MIENIFFQGSQYLLIGSKRFGGAIATKDQYENLETSYAHLHRDGNISRFGAIIGNVKDIKFSVDNEDGANDVPPGVTIMAVPGLNMTTKTFNLPEWPRARPPKLKMTVSQEGATPCIRNQFPGGVPW